MSSEVGSIGAATIVYQDDNGEKLVPQDALKRICQKHIQTLISHRLNPETTFPLPVDDVVAIRADSTNSFITIVNKAGLEYEFQVNEEGARERDSYLQELSECASSDCSSRYSPSSTESETPYSRRGKGSEADAERPRERSRHRTADEAIQTLCDCHEDQIAGLNAEIQHLREIRTGLEAEKHTTELRSETLGAELNQVQSQLAGLKEASRQDVTIVTQLRARTAQLEDNLKNATQEADALKKQIAQLEPRLLALQETLSEVTAKHAQVESELRARTEAAEAREIALAATNADLTRALEKQSAKLDSAQQNAAASASALQAKEQELQHAAQATRAKIDELEGVIAHLTNDNHLKEEKLQELETFAKNREKRVKKLRKDLTQLRKNYESLQAQFSKYEETHVPEALLTSARKDREQLQQQLGKLNADLTKNQHDALDNLKQLHEALTSGNAKSARIADLDKTIAELRESLAQRPPREDKSDQLAEIQAQLSAAKSSIDTLTATVDTVKKEKADLVAVTDQQDARIAALTDQLNRAKEVNAHIDELRGEIRELRKDLLSAQEDLDLKTQELHSSEELRATALQEHAQTLEKTKTEMAGLTQQIVALMDAQKASQAELNKRVEEAQKMADALNASEDKAALAERRVAELATVAAVQRADLASKDGKISELQAANAALQRDAIQNAELLNQLQQKLAAERIEKKAATDRAEAAEQRAGALNTALQAKQTDVERLTRETNGLADQLRRAEANKADLADRVDDLSARLEASEKKLAALDQQKEKDAQGLARITTDNARIANELRGKKAEAEAASAKVQQLTQQLAKQEKKFAADTQELRAALNIATEAGADAERKANGLQSQLNALDAANQKLLSDQAALGRQAQEQQSRVQALAADLSAANKQRDDAERKAAELDALVKSQVAILADKDKELQAVSIEAAQLRSDLAERAAPFREDPPEEATMEPDNTTLELAIQAVHEEAEQAKTRAAALEAELLAQRATLDELQAAKAQAIKDADAARSDFAELSEQLRQAKAAAAAAVREIAPLQQQLEAQELELDNRTKLLKSYVDQAEQKATSAEARVQSLSEKLQAQTQRARALNADNDDLQAYMGQLQKQKDETKTALDEATALLAANEQQIAALTHDNDQLWARLRESQQKEAIASKKETEASVVGALTITDLKQQLEREKTEKEEILQRMRDLESANDEFQAEQEEIRGLIEGYQPAEYDTNEERSALLELRKQIHGVGEDLAQARGDRDALLQGIAQHVSDFDAVMAGRRPVALSAAKVAKTGSKALGRGASGRR